MIGVLAGRNAAPMWFSPREIKLGSAISKFVTVGKDICTVVGVAAENATVDALSQVTFRFTLSIAIALLISHVFVPSVNVTMQPRLSSWTTL